MYKTYNKVFELQKKASAQNNSKQWISQGNNNGKQ